MGRPLTQTDLTGEDLLPQPRLLASEDKCRELCEASGNCMALTYVKMAFADHKAGECWLKKAIPQQSPSDFTVSAIKNPK
jgi:hypothetical protein